MDCIDPVREAAEKAFETITKVARAGDVERVLISFRPDGSVDSTAFLEVFGVVSTMSEYLAKGLCVLYLCEARCPEGVMISGHLYRPPGVTGGYWFTLLSPGRKAGVIQYRRTGLPLKFHSATP